MVIQLFLIAAGLLILTAGADWLVRGATGLALSAGISTLVIGLTVVSFGTSAPELAVSVTSAYAGSSDMAVANAVGSNIFNLLVILGISSLVAPLVVHSQLVRLDIPIMLGTALLLYSLATDGVLGRLDAALLASLMAAYLLFLVVEARRGRSGQPVANGNAESPPTTPASTSRNILLIASGLVLLVTGSRLLVSSAVEVARMLAISEVIIGLTLVAAGTSLPELATSVMAALRGERDIAIGNVVGSNIFNICAVLGLSGLLAPGELAVAPSMLRVDIPVMIGVSLLCLPLLRANYTLTRRNGAVFLSGYAIYLFYLIWQQMDHPGLGTLQTLILSLFIPALIVYSTVYLVAALRKP